MANQRRAPRNTAREAHEDVSGVLAEAMLFGSEDTLRRQESQGQQSLIGSDTLPTDMGIAGHHDVKAILEAAGMKFLGVVEGDELFQYVELPEGWAKKPTDHPMWSKLVDDKGRERVAIFYKAIFYDRRAEMRLTRRFDVQRDYDRENKEGVAVAEVTKSGEVVYTTEPIQLPEDQQKRYEVAQQATAAATTWLDQQYPDWRNPGAYWD